VKPHFLILANEQAEDHLLWVAACEDYKEKLSYDIISLTASDWLSQIKKHDQPDALLVRPPASTNAFRQLYLERLDILVNDLGYTTFPAFEETRIYESKRFFAYWAEAHQIPHPRTFVFYEKEDARHFIQSHPLPLVGKLNIGASGHGVEILKTQEKALNYINRAFKKGLTASTGPNLKKRKLLKRAWSKIRNPQKLLNKIRQYQSILEDKQKGYVILQEFIPHDFEWRVVRIGDSFFAHKKLKQGEKASGSLLKNYDNPPISLIDFTKELTDRFNFNSVAVDIFEGKAGYLVNEIQCIFGQSDSFQMKVDDVVGRYRFIARKWEFEPGDFNQNECYNLRMKYLLDTLARI
jgi:glutathione synthase/RimK-type ligase-like ATP-grasp enzyme